MGTSTHTKPSAREALRAAIAVRDEAAALVREVAATLARAGRLATDAQRRLDVLGRRGRPSAGPCDRRLQTFRGEWRRAARRRHPGAPAERQGARDTARQELAAATAAQAQLRDEHAAAQGEHGRREREVAAAADAVIAEMSLLTWGRYVQAIEAARAAWDDAAAICAMTPDRPAVG